MRIIQLKVDDILEKIIEEIKLESGFATDQEFLRKVIEEYHVRANQATVESSNSTVGDNPWENAELQIKEKIDEKSIIAVPADPSNHPLLTIDLVDMMHNKIFPVILVLKTLHEITESNPDGWVELNSFKKIVIEKAKQVAREYPELAVGLPQTEESLKKKYHRINRRIEQGIKSNSSFTDRFVGYIHPIISSFTSEKNDEITYGFFGAPAEWGLIEGRIDRDTDWIRLTKKAIEFLNLPSVKSKNNPLSDEDHNVALWLMKNIFSEIKLEFKIMKYLLSKKQFGDENKSGLDEMEKKFYEMQKKHLMGNLDKSVDNDLAKGLKIPTEEKTRLETIAEKMIDWEDNKKGRNRVGATINRLMEMNLFQKKGKSVYVRTLSGEKVFDKLK